jgi:nitrogen regulatory protein P-II 1
MKLIIAVIQPEELPAIKEEFLKRKIYKFTVTNAKGQGVEYPLQEVYRGVAHEIKLLNKVRLEMAVNDEFVDSVIESITTIEKKDGDKGRGKIFILPIDECIRIRSGETGTEAIG